MSKKGRAAAESGLKEGVPSFIQQAGLYILMGALLLGVIWNGGYFPNSKLVFTSLLLIAGGWELMVIVALGEWRSLRSFSLWVLAALAIFSAASHGWTLNTELTDRETALLFGLLAAILVPRAQALRLGAGTVESLVNWLIYTAGFVSAWGIITYLLRTAPYVELVDDLYRAGSTFQYSNGLSCFALMALPVTLAMHQSGREKDRPLYATAAAIEIASIVVAFSRSGLAALVAILIYFLATSYRRQLLSVTVFTMAAGFLMAATALVMGEADTWPTSLFNFLAARGWQNLRVGSLAIPLIAAQAALTWIVLRQAGTERGGRIFRKAIRGAVGAAAVLAVLLVAVSSRAQEVLETRFIKGFAWSKIFPHRTATWDAAWRAFKDKPVKGWGMGEFYEIFARYETAKPTRFAHNLVLEMAVDTGIIGAVLITAFLIFVAAVALLRLVTRTSLMTRALAIAAMVFIFYNMFDWEWYIPAITAWFMVAVTYIEGGFPREEN